MVVDTNVLISGAFGKGETISQLFKILFDQHELLCSKELIGELEEKRGSVKLRKFIDESRGRKFINQFLENATKVVVKYQVTACRDPKDDKILSLTIEGKADCIVSGDKDLLILNPFKTIPIVTPFTFLNTY